MQQGVQVHLLSLWTLIQFTLQRTNIYFPKALLSGWFSLSQGGICWFSGAYDVWLNINHLTFTWWPRFRSPFVTEAVRGTQWFSKTSGTLCPRTAPSVSSAQFVASKNGRSYRCVFFIKVEHYKGAFHVRGLKFGVPISGNMSQVQGEHVEIVEHFLFRHLYKICPVFSEQMSSGWPFSLLKWSEQRVAMRWGL